MPFSTSIDQTMPLIGCKNDEQITTVCKIGFQEHSAVQSSHTDPDSTAASNRNECNQNASAPIVHPTHTSERPFKCGDCPKRFRNVYNLKSHELDVHSEKKFICEQCNKGFGRECALLIHLQIHSKVKQFACRYCPRKFTYKVDLKTHRLDIHSAKKFKCDRCGKAFGRERSLRQHLVSHSEVKPFRCEDCQKQYARKGQLKSHQLDCHTKKQFKCPQCGLGFGREAILRKHLVVHSERFKCDQCEKSYKHKKGLTQHHRLTQHSTGHRDLVKDRKKLAKKFEQLDNRSIGADYGLRTRLRARLGKTLNYLVDEDTADESESDDDGLLENRGNDSDYQATDDELSESDEERGEEDYPVGRESDLVEMPTKRVKTENSVMDEVYDDPIEGGKKKIKREPDWDGLPGNDLDIASTTIASSFDVDDPYGVLQEESSDAGVCWKVKYEGPVPSELPNEPASIDCYDFNDLIRAYQIRIKEERLSSMVNTPYLGDHLKIEKN